jgi:hypothetical protein
VWPEVLRILLIQTQSYENFGEYDSMMKVVFKKMINMEPVQFNTLLTYQEKLALITVIVDSIHTLNYFRTFLNSRLDAMATFKKDKQEFK